MLTYTITLDHHGRRLESFVSSLIPTATNAYIRKLIRGGAVKLQGGSSDADTFLECGAMVTVKESATLLALLSSSAPALDLLYEDSQVAIVNKPAGLAMHRTAECEDNLVDQGMSYMTWRGTACKLYPVNRLDRGTSGAVILAKSSASAGMYGRQVKEVGLDKLYLALVYGTPEQAGTINEALDGKESETRYRILVRGEHNALLAVQPISGRMHQIRRHLESIGHPVVGDKRYGGSLLESYQGFALHSYRTVVQRPGAGELSVCAPLPLAVRQLCLEDRIREQELTEALKSLW